MSVPGEEDFEAEQAVLGSILLEPERFPDVRARLTKEDFCDPWHQKVFEEMGKMVDAGGPIDPIALPVPEKAQLLFLTECVPCATNLPWYVRRVLEKTQGRKFRAIVRDVQDLAELSDDYTANIRKAHELFSAAVRPEESSDASDAHEAFLQAYKEREERKPEAGALNTGLGALDALIGGLLPGEVIVIAGRPSTGKSALLGQILAHNALQGRGVLWCSLETRKKAIIDRLLALHSGLSMHVLKAREPPPDTWSKIAQSSARFSETRLRFHDSGMLTTSTLSVAARKMREEKGLDLIGIDYLQLMRLDGKAKEGNREQEVAAMSRNIKILALALEVPIIALSQLSRNCESREDRMPRLSDLRESGAIEQDADKIIMLYPNPKDPDGVRLCVRKNRDGMIGDVNTYFDKKIMRFYDEQDPEVPSFSKSKGDVMRTPGRV